jgi:putative ABC transport system permease protein
MYKNYLNIAIRNLFKNKWYSILNISGLAVGIACCILIFAWAEYHVGVDKFHENIESIYLVRTLQDYGQYKSYGDGTPPALGPAVLEEYPEVVNMARINNGTKYLLLTHEEQKHKEHFFFSDASLFEIFSFPLIEGTFKQGFNDPNTIILSRKAADKYFPDENPVGAIMTLDNQYDLTVIGVVQDIPQNSTIQFDYWIPIQFLRKLNRPNYIDTWYNLAFRTYIQLQPNTSLRNLNVKLHDRIRQSRPETHSDAFAYPFADVYLKLWGVLRQISLFTVIGLFILVIACINFINLSTARSSDRAKEVSLRKVVGAEQKQLMHQFFLESMLVTILAAFLAVILVEISFPWLYPILGEELQVQYFNDSNILLGIIIITILTGLIAGIFPALFLSSMKPLKILTGRLYSGSGTGYLRKFLVVSQFVISTFLIISTLVFFNQVDYMKSKFLGFDTDNLVYTPLQGTLIDNWELYKSELLKNPHISSISVTSHSPSGIYWNGQDWSWDGRDPAVNPLVTYFCADHDFVNTFNVKMSEGTFFTADADAAKDIVVINDNFATIIDSAVVTGKILRHGSESYKIIGVIKDFHYKPVYTNVGPLIMFNNTDIRQFKYAFIKLTGGSIQEAIHAIEETTTRLNPEFPFEYRFLDEDYAGMYHNVEQFSDIIRALAFLAIFISCLGLFGLASYMAEHRTKEIGVRKVLGATVSGILIIMSKEFTKWVLLANLIAWPLAYIFVLGWLQNFANRITIGLGTFVFALLLTLLLALLTVSSQSLKAALSNPVDSLRYE